MRTKRVQRLTAGWDENPATFKELEDLADGTGAAAGFLVILGAAPAIAVAGATGGWAESSNLAGIVVTAILLALIPAYAVFSCVASWQLRAVHAACDQKWGSRPRVRQPLGAGEAAHDRFELVRTADGAEITVGVRRWTVDSAQRWQMLAEWVVEPRTFALEDADERDDWERECREQAAVLQQEQLDLLTTQRAELEVQGERARTASLTLASEGRRELLS